jgi:hypothetical protein
VERNPSTNKGPPEGPNVRGQNRSSTVFKRNVACAAGRWSQRPLTIGVTKGACEAVERNNYLASEPVGIPIELQLTLKVVDDPADHSCAEAFATGRLNGRAACLTPADHKLRLATRPLD